MPTYTYECKKCGIVEVVQRMADTELTQCPECGGKCRKVIIHVPAAKVVEDWASQNNGRGKRIPQMEKNVHDRKYYKSRSALTEECRKKGYTWE